MKKLLPLIVLVLAILACGQAPAIATVAQEQAPPTAVVIVVTATPEPVIEMPTAAVIVPSSGLESEVIALVTGMGMDYEATQNKGENDCGEDRCIHFTFTNNDRLAVYITGGKVVGVAAMMEVGGNYPPKLGAVSGTVVGTYWRPTEAEIECLGNTKVGGTSSCGRLFRGIVVDGNILMVIDILKDATNTGGSI
jgi:hypothetical protein